MLDWLISIAAAGVLCLLAAGLILAASDLDRRDPPSWSLYLALLIMSLWPPLWFLYTSLAWAWRGATAGMRLAGICVVSQRGDAPQVRRSATRTLFLTLLSTPVLASPILIAVAVSLGTAGTVWIVVPIAVAIIVSVAACASSMLRADGAAWHDRLSATRVVSAPGRSGT